MASSDIVRLPLCALTCMTLKWVLPIRMRNICWEIDMTGYLVCDGWGMDFHRDPGKQEGFFVCLFDFYHQLVALMYIKKCLGKFKDGEASLGIVCSCTTLWRALGKILAEDHCAQVEPHWALPSWSSRTLFRGLNKLWEQEQKNLVQSWAQEQN